MFVAAIVCGSLFLESCGRDASYSGLGSIGTELSGQFSSDFDLINQDGEAVRDEDFRGKVMIVYFGYTNCPDVCPGDIGVLSAALFELEDKAEAVAPIFITVDSERDTPQVLNAYLSFDKRITGLTGGTEAVEAARRSFKLYAQKQAQPDSALGYTFDHQRFYYIVDRTGQPIYAIFGGASPKDLANVLRRSIKR